LGEKLKNNRSWRSEVASIVPIFHQNNTVILSFVWIQSDILNGNEAFLSEVKHLITFRIAGVHTKQSLRFDTKDNDTAVTFPVIGKQPPTI